MQQLFSGQLIKKLFLYLGDFFNAVDNDVFVGGMHAFTGSRMHNDNRTALGESSGIRAEGKGSGHHDGHVMFTCLRARALAEGPRLRFFKLWGTLGIFSLPGV